MSVHLSLTEVFSIKIIVFELLDKVRDIYMHESKLYMFINAIWKLLLG